MKKILLLVAALILPVLATSNSSRICYRFQKKCQKQYSNPSGAFLRSLITKEMRECLKDPSCEMRNKVLDTITYNEVIVEDLGRMSIILSNSIEQRKIINHRKKEWK